MLQSLRKKVQDQHEELEGAIVGPDPSSIQVS